MDWKLNYGQSVLVLPTAALEANATHEQLRVLLWLASDASLLHKPTQLARLADTNAAGVSEALEFWRQNGVLEGEAIPTPQPKRRAQKPTQAEGTVVVAPAAPLRRADELPTYTTTELADLLEQRDSLRGLVDESQKLFGKIFTAHELNILFGMADYLSLSEEYILLLLAHCRRMEIKSLRAVEKYAIALLDEGVTTASQLDAHLQKAEARHTLEGKVRVMFGINTRSLTSKEKKMLDAWIGFGYGEEIIRMAYEITVNSTGNASLPYANSILTRWNEEGMKTAEDIERLIAQEKAQKEGAQATRVGSSFEADDFLEAAIQRSFRKSGGASEA